MKKSAPLKILFVATEVSPFSKTGGLGDVVGSLPKALRARGVDARVVFPKYATIPPEMLKGMRRLKTFTVHLSWRAQYAAVCEADDTDGAPVYMIESDFYFGRDNLYGFGDDFERFAFFSKAAVEMLSYIDFQADVIHFHDWQTGLGCAYLRDSFNGFTFYSNMKSLFTIHNLHYQGVFGREVLWSVGLNDGYFTNGSIEFFNNISYMKAGVMYSDAVSTVSHTYAQEIQTPDFGFGMDGLLRQRGAENRLFGITNGIDTDAYNPKTDTMIYENFDMDSLHLKRENKHRLQADLGLPVGDMPMIGIISRLVDQKGFDIISIIMEELLNRDIQLVVLGTGEGRYENLFKSYAWHRKDKVSANIYFNEERAHKIYASSDLFLVPSVYEPCGLTQLYAMRYGGIPIVRKTGGLADTVRHYDPATEQGNGFVFEDFVASGLMWAINSALAVYGTDKWEKLIRNAMSDDFSWDCSAGEYIALYKKIKKY